MEKEEKPHSISLENRKRCQMSGVTKVISATNTCITLQTSMGALVVTGVDLKLTAYSETNGNLSMQGEITSLKYGSKTSAFKKIFG